MQTGCIPACLCVVNNELAPKLVNTLWVPPDNYVEYPHHRKDSLHASFSSLGMFKTVAGLLDPPLWLRLRYV